MTNEELIIQCEHCEKEILEKDANAFYIGDNYLIVCDKCYKELEVNNDR